MKKDKNISPFGKRLLEAFNHAPKGEIAKEIGVQQSALTNYLQTRIPDAEKLQIISNFTNCSIHWLVTGDGTKEVIDEKVAGLINTKNLKSIVREIIREEINNGNMINEKIQGIVMAMKPNVKTLRELDEKESIIFNENEAA